MNGCCCFDDPCQEVVKGNIVLGLCQFLLSVVFVGWVHSVLWGLKIYR